MKLRNSWLFVEIIDLVTNFVFFFSHQLKQPQDYSLSINLCQFLYKDYLISFSQWPPTLSSYNPILQIKKLRLREVKPPT